MKLKIENRQNRMVTAEMWMHKPRWRRHYQYQQRRKYNSVAFTLLKMSADDFRRMTKSHVDNNAAKNSTSHDASPHLQWHYSLPSYLIDELIMNNTLSSDLTSSLLIKNEKVTKRLDEIVTRQQSLTTTLNAEKNYHLASNTLYTSSLNSKYVEFNSGLVYKHDCNHHSIGDSAINESFVYETSLDSAANLNHNVNDTMKRQGKIESLKNSLCNKSNIKEKNVNLKLGSCNNIDNITIYLNDIDASRYHVDKDCYRKKLRDNTGENCETILVFIQEENIKLQKNLDRDACVEKYRNVSTSTTGISPCNCNENTASTITDHCPFCSSNKKSKLVRYTLPTCIVKDVEQIPRYKNNPWNRVLSKVTAKNNNRHSLSNNDLKVIQSLSTMTIIDKIPFDNCESSPTISSSSVDKNQISPMNLIHATLNCPKQSLFRLYDSSISSTFSSSTSLLSIPPLLPQKKSKGCIWRQNFFQQACNFSSTLS